MLLDRGIERIGDAHEAAVAFLMAVAVVELLEEIDVDEDGHETAAEQLPVVPVIAQLLVNGAPVFQPGQRIGPRQPEQRPAPLRRFLLLCPRFEGIQEDVVALLC